MPQSVRAVDGGKIKGPANVPGVIEIAFLSRISPSKMIRNIVHGSFTTPPSNMQTLATQLYSSISTAWAGNLATLMATTTSFVEVQIRDMSNFLNPIFIATGTAIPGTAAGAAMPFNNAIVLTEEIATRGKGLKGRIFLGGWSVDADGGSGAITSAAQQAADAFGLQLINAITSNNLDPCVAQVARQAYIGLTGTQHTARAASKVHVISYLCKDQVWDSQRRRVQ
jgi:hypothetical protein